MNIRLRVREEVKTVVSPSETITLIIRQSLWHSISPSALVFTDRRLLIIHHSFWGLYTRINVISPTEINIVEHKNIKSVALGMGILFGTVRLRVLGFVEPTLSVKYEWDMDGMWHKDALEVTNVVGRVIEARSAADDAKESQTNAKEGIDEDANTRRSDMMLKGGYAPPVAYVIKNEKVVAKEKIDVPKQNSKIYGRLFGSLILAVGILGGLSSLGYNVIPFLDAGAYFSLANSTFIAIIGILLIKLA